MLTTFSINFSKTEHMFDPSVYNSEVEMLKDLAMAVRHEIMTLYDAGVRFFQIDDPNMTFFCDPGFIKNQEAEGVDLDAMLDLHIKSHNNVLADLPADLRIGIHLCRGNFPNGIFLGTGAYNKIASKLFRDLDYKLYYLEYDSDRAGDFTPLEHLPKDKAVVLGIVTTKDAKMENVDALKARVVQAADIIAKGQGVSREEALTNNIAISPQCGFASASDGHGVDMSEMLQWKKLELLRDVARDIWPQQR
jgi:methionine synthase II (cobalamin-independent)